MDQRPALDGLAAELYDELHQLARAALRPERADHTLQPTALLHEAFLRLAGGAELDLGNRHRFLALAAKVMRQILVDYARTRGRRKRGGGNLRVTLSSGAAVEPAIGLDVLALHQAMERLATLDPRQVEIIELRLWLGLEVEEVAAVMGLSSATIKRETATARAWLVREMGHL